MNSETAGFTMVVIVFGAFPIIMASVLIWDQVTRMLRGIKSKGSVVAYVLRNEYYQKVNYYDTKYSPIVKINAKGLDYLFVDDHYGKKIRNRIGDSVPVYLNSDNYVDSQIISI